MHQDQEAYWDQAAEEKKFTTPFQIEKFSRHVKKDAAILDIGCGYGRVLDELHQEGFTHLLGVDFSGVMIKKGRQQFPHLLFQKASMPLPFRDHQFDAVLLVAVLTCIASSREQAQLIHEIQRLLKPGGILYINDFLVNSDARNTARYEKYAEEYGDYGVFELPEGAVLRHHDPEYVRILLKGFELIEFTEETYVTMNRHQSRGFYCIGRIPPESSGFQS